MSLTPSIIIVDDDAAVRDSLRFLFETHDYDVQVYESGDQFLEVDLSTVKSPILMDVKMPGRDGLKTIREALSINGALQFIMMSGHGDIPLAVRAMKMGAKDFIEKPFDDVDLLWALGKLNSLELTVPTKDIKREPALKLQSVLTQREYEIALLLVEGFPNKLIANRLGISIRTVETHRARILIKLGIRSLSELVKLALSDRPS